MEIDILNKKRKDLIEKQQQYEYKPIENEVIAREKAYNEKRAERDELKAKWQTIQNEIDKIDETISYIDQVIEEEKIKEEK